MRKIKQLIVRKVKQANSKLHKTKTKNAQRQHRFFGTLGQKSQLVRVRMDRGCAGNITIKLRGVRMQITLKLNGTVPNA